MEDKPAPMINYLNNDTPGETGPEDLTGSMEFKFLYNNNQFILTISMDSKKKYLCLQAEEEGNIAYLYEKQMNFDDLKNFDKIYRTCDDIEDALNSTIVIFKGDKNLIKEVNEKELIISINIRQLDGSFKTKDFILLKKSKNKDSIIDNLCQSIFELKKNNNNLQKELDKAKQKIEILEEKVNDHEFRLYTMDSCIITKRKEYDFIVERIKKLDENNEEAKNNKIKLSLIYRGTRDGDEAKKFHEKCDKFKNTLIVVETKKGLRFGGFTCETWSGNGDKVDKNAFCFSLDKSKIYNWTKGKSSIYVSPSSGPTFGNCVFEIKDNFLELGGLCSEDYFYDNQQTQCDINNGEEQFDIIDMEVFYVSY